MKIDSSSIVEHLDSMIVHLAKVISIEKMCTIEDSMEATRKVLGKKAGELLDKKIIEDLQVSYRSKVRSGTVTQLEKQLYKLLEDTGII